MPSHIFRVFEHFTAKTVFEHNIEWQYANRYLCLNQRILSINTSSAGVNYDGHWKVTASPVTVTPLEPESIICPYHTWCMLLVNNGRLEDWPNDSDILAVFGPQRWPSAVRYCGMTVSVHGKKSSLVSLCTWHSASDSRWLDLAAHVTEIKTHSVERSSTVRADIIHIVVETIRTV